MRALVAWSYGPPNTLRIEETPIPEPGLGQIQVKVSAASLNPADLMMTSGDIREAFETRFPYVPGSDFAGTVTKLGPGIRAFAVGEEVFGFGVPHSYAERFNVPAVTSGGLAEYAVFQADGPFVAHRPAGLPPETAAALASTGMTAVAAVADGDFQPGEKVLVIGASGGVGSIVVQLLAKKQKAEVVATAIPEHADYARSHGATHTIDYQTFDVVTAIRELYPDGVDAIVNLVLDGDRLAAAARALRPGGRVISTTFSSIGGDGVTVKVVNGPPSLRADTFPTLAAQALDGTLEDLISRTYSFDQAVQALADLAAAEHTRGKWVITMPR